MKVIVQDLQTKAYLSADGRWIMSKENAADFETLLRAYHYARVNTSGGFELFIYCPEDDYSASIITGMGIAESKTPMASETVETKTPELEHRNFLGNSRSRCGIASRFDETKNHLN